MTEDSPIAYTALAVGTPVQDTDGAPFGTVEHVLQEPDMDLFDGLAVTTKRGLRFVDKDRISTITASAVLTSLSAADIAELPAPQGDEIYTVDALKYEGDNLSARLGRMFGRPHWTEHA
jgi:hypothetical protein